MARPFVVCNEDHAVDAEAIRLVDRQAEVQSVAVSSGEREGVLALHGMRHRPVKFGTLEVNALRGLLTEYGQDVRPRPSRYGRRTPPPWSGSRAGDRAGHRDPGVAVDASRLARGGGRHGGNASWSSTAFRPTTLRLAAFASSVVASMATVDFAATCGNHALQCPSANGLVRLDVDPARSPLRPRVVRRGLV